MRRLSWLTALEVLSVVAWLALAGVYLSRGDDQGHLVPIDVEALAQGVTAEEWMGIYFHDQKVGYAVTGTTATSDGGQIIQNRSAFRMQAFGEVKEIVTAGTALVAPDLTLRRFDFFMSSDPVRLSARGEVRAAAGGGSELVIEVLQAGEVQQLELPLDAPPQLSLTLAPYIKQQAKGEIKEGMVFEVPYFDPASLAQDVMVMRVVDTELLDNGEEAFWVERYFGDVETRVLITSAGQVLREEGALGLSLVRQTRDEARQLPTGEQPVDIIALSAAPLKGRIRAPRESVSLALRISGVEPERIMNDPPGQTVEGDVVRIRTPLKAELPDPPRVYTGDSLAPYLAASPFLPVGHRDIQDQALKLVGDIEGRRAAVGVLVDWVYGYLEKTPTVGVPNALEVLRVGQGDCNEHTSLFVALARAGGIPARIAAGVAYTDRIGDRGAFYYHAWPEVYLGPETGGGWVPVDPTFGQFPADATHVKLVEGDLDRQIELMGVMGRVGFEVVEDASTADEKP